MIQKHEQTSIIPLLVKKEMKIRPTNKQKKLAIAMVENMNSNDPLTKKEVLASVSYGKLASQPSRVLESKGYLQALRDLGLTEELVTTSLVEDIEKKPQNRVKELALASDILQMRKPVDIDKNNDNSKGNTYNFLFNATTQQQIQDINEAIKQRLLSQ